MVLCLCLDLAIGLSLAPPCLTRIGATGIWSSSFQIEAGLRPGDLFFVSFFPKRGVGGRRGMGECRDLFGGVEVGGRVRKGGGWKRVKGCC